MNRPVSLTARLVLTAVALVVATSLLIGVAATLAMQATLTQQVDDEVRRLVGRGDDGPGPGGRGGPPGQDEIFDARNLPPDTLLAIFSDTESAGVVLGGGPGEVEVLAASAVAVLDEVPVDGEIHEVDLGSFGTYRVTAVEAEDGIAVTGRPTSEVDDAVASLLTYEALLIALGAGLAGVVGVVVVRRQLRPLTEVAATADRVAALPLAEGDIELAERVPERLTDERTEVGQVGAALNALLAHVETSLEERHRSEQQVRQFVADASHELRTPLSTITGYTELARTRPDVANLQTALAKVEEESGRMTDLVEDLLLLARLDAGRPLARDRVDLTRLLVEAVSDARVLAPDHEWRLVLADDPAEPLEVVGDEQRLHQVVTNLLTNARKHTPVGTVVTVAVRPTGFSVHDDGPGFASDFVAHAFERFARGDQSRERSGGAGLGLSIVEAIVESHGGSVHLTSSPGDTTTRVDLQDFDSLRADR